jgi:hypothetical protein
MLIVERTVDDERYAAEPADATPSTPLLKPTMMRFDDGRRDEVRRVVASPSDFRARREKVAANGFVPAAVTTPVIVEPFVATNATDAPETAALVTVTTCVAGVGPSVHVVVDFPSEPVVVVAGETDPPPTALHVSATFPTPWLSASSTWTTSGESTGVETFAT